MTEHKVIYEINQNLYLLAKVRFPAISDLLNNWTHLIERLERYRQLGRKEFSLVKWDFPPTGTFKCNTDSCSSETYSLLAFCIRNSEGDLVYAEAKIIPHTNCLKVEALAIQKGVEYCVKLDFSQLL